DDVCEHAEHAFEPRRELELEIHRPGHPLQQSYPGDVEDRGRPHARELLRRRILQRAPQHRALRRGAPNCQSNLETAIRGYGMDRSSFNVDACFNIFMTVAYDADGKWEIRPPKGKPGDYMVMRALMPQIVAMSNCPVLFNACNNFRLKPLTL